MVVQVGAQLHDQGHFDGVGSDGDLQRTCLDLRGQLLEGVEPVADLASAVVTGNEGIDAIDRDLVAELTRQGLGTDRCPSIASGTV